MAVSGIAEGHPGLASTRSPSAPHSRHRKMILKELLLLADVKHAISPRDFTSRIHQRTSKAPVSLLASKACIMNTRGVVKRSICRSRCSTTEASCAWHSRNFSNTRNLPSYNVLATRACPAAVDTRTTRSDL